VTEPGSPGSAIQPDDRGPSGPAEDELASLDPMRRAALRLMSAAVLAWHRTRRGTGFSVGHRVIANHRLIVKGPGTVVIGDRANVFAFGAGRRTRLVVHAPDAVIRVGPNVRINGGELHAARSIEIGANCIIGQAFITDTDGHSVRQDRRTNRAAPVTVAPVVLEHDVWIARDAAILPGVRVGAGSVVAYGAVVVDDVPPNVLVAGNPARVVRQLD
jgi:carbonic anhydrase/acetyltransferase-like protein (isoleucine patch superfamily)